MSRVVLLSLALLSSACAAALHPTPSAGLIVACPDKEAWLYLDDVLVGRADDFARQPLRLQPGFHRLELRAEGRVTAYREVTLAAGQTAQVAVKLRPDLDQTDAVSTFP